MIVFFKIASFCSSLDEKNLLHSCMKTKKLMKRHLIKASNLKKTIIVSESWQMFGPFLFCQGFSTFSTFFTTWRAFLAANPPIDTWSSVPALVERESTEAGWHKVLFSDTGKWRKCQELRKIEGSYFTIKGKEMVKKGRDVSFLLVPVGFYTAIICSNWHKVLFSDTGK